MAFNRENLLHIGGVSPLPQTWEYFSADTITTKGYFPATGSVKDGDHVTKVTITRNNSTKLITGYSRTEYYMVADADGALTATAVA